MLVLRRQNVMALLVPAMTWGDRQRLACRDAALRVENHAPAAVLDAGIGDSSAAQTGDARADGGGDETCSDD